MNSTVNTVDHGRTIIVTEGPKRENIFGNKRINVGNIKCML